VLEPYFQGPRCRTYKLMLVPDMLARIPYAFCLNVNDLQNFLAPLVHGGRTFVPQIFAYEMAATSYIFLVQRLCSSALRPSFRGWFGYVPRHGYCRGTCTIRFPHRDTLRTSRLPIAKAVRKNEWIFLAKSTFPTDSLCKLPKIAHSLLRTT
jgi:hypothetical protein